MNAQTLFLILAALLLQSSTQAERVACRLELQLDQNPRDTAWEIRGPVPTTDILYERSFDSYQEAGKLQEELIPLEVGQTYYFILSDYSDDGIKDGHFKIYAAHVQGDVLLAEGDGKFGSGMVARFEVTKPSQPEEESFLGTALSYLRGRR
jgi:hypothetical protein